MVQVVGFKELDAALAELPEAFRRQVLLKAIRKAGKPMVKEAKARARRASSPRRRGGHRIGSAKAAAYGLNKALADSIEISAVDKSPSYPSEVAMKLGPDAAHFYGLFVEKGTKAKKARKDTTWHPGMGIAYSYRLRGHRAYKSHHATRAYPFLEPAFKMHVERTIEAMGKELWSELSKKARSLARAAERGTISKKAGEALLR